MVITIWKGGAVSSGSLYGNVDSPFPYGDVAQTLFGNRLVTEPSPFENGDPFLYGDPHIEMRAGKSQSLSQNLGEDALQRVTWRSPNEHSPFPYVESPYGNGHGDSDIHIWGIPVSKQSLFPSGD